MNTVSSRKTKRQSRIAIRSAIVIFPLLILFVGSTLAYITFKSWSFASQAVAIRTIPTNGADQWVDDDRVTVESAAFSLPNAKDVSVSPLFAHYYQDHGAAKDLGDPITVAFPTSQGWLQFFTAGALLAPAISPTPTPSATTTLATSAVSTSSTDDPVTEMVKNSIKDLATGIIRLPLLQTLLTVGSQVPLGNQTSTMTYVDLRKATNPNLMQPAPAAHQAATTSTAQEIFIKGGTRAGKDVGHLVAQPFWQYMTRPDISPHGWENDFGAPLTESLPFTITSNGTTHHMQVQAFARDALLLDQDDASGQPTVQRLTTGLDYLSTLGPPAVVTAAQQTVWVQNSATLLNAAATGQALAHVSQSFPLQLQGTSNWNAGMLWYAVQWSTPKNTGKGWVPATNVTFTQPDSATAWASIDTLSSDLSSYLAKLDPDAGVVVYDLTNQRYYTYNSATQFTMASSIKLPIMLTFFDMTEGQGREPDDDEMNLLTTMIENSNNDSASALYYNEIGGSQGITNFLQKVGVSGLTPNVDTWGYSLTTPQAMVDLLKLLYTGKILTAQDRATAINLLENVESDQQVGVGDTAPNGATVAMKDGWVTEDDDLWAMNTSGIVTLNKETYIIAVYTQEQQSLDDGQAIARHVCSTIASLLT